MVPGTVLVTIVTTDPIYAYFDADERAFFKYRKAGAAPGDPGRKGAALPCELGLDGEDGFPHKGRVDFHDNRVDPVTATLRMRAVLENRDGALVPGAFARVRLPVERMESALLIPESAIGSEQTLKFVFVINAEQAVEARPVRLGRQEGTRRVVLSGLKPDDRVVVQGVMMLRPGVKVRVQEGGAPVARAAS
jgi:RND family efflux transporter MFP subunit